MNTWDDVECQDCGWSGASSEMVDFVHCPECNSTNINDCDPEPDAPIWEYFDGFNWNKK